MGPIRALAEPGSRARGPRYDSGMIAARLLCATTLLCLAACDGLDHRQVRLCERVFAELEEDAPRLTRIGIEELPKSAQGPAIGTAIGPGVVLVLRDKADAAAPPRRFVCRFAGGRFEPGQTELIGLVRLSGEPVGDLTFTVVRRRLGLGY